MKTQFSVVLLLLVLSNSTLSEAKDTLVANVAEFDAAVKVAQPGDAIVLKNGEWRDVELVFRGEGLNELGSTPQPITLRAESPGQVVLTGKSRLRMGGRQLLVCDLLWKDTTAEDEVVSFRIDSETRSRGCILANCAILNDAAGGDRKWVSVYGRFNKVRHCRFEGKRSAGALIAVWLSEGDPNNHTRIENNFFGSRERLGKNGGEIIRIGDSKTSELECWSIVKENYFYRCSGEAEIISSKSRFSTYHQNTFVGCGGALTFRHGHSCSAFSNAFFGDGQPGTGGVRIIGSSHDVFDNLFYELTGEGTRAAVSIMNGIPDSPLNGYAQVRRALVQDNTFIDCKESLVVGLSDEDEARQTLPPLGCIFERNAVISEKRPIFFLRNTAAEMHHDGNIYLSEHLGITADGWRRVANAPTFNLVHQEYPAAGEDGFTIKKFTLRAPQPSDVGPEWLRPGDEFLPEVLKPKVK